MSEKNIVTGTINANPIFTNKKSLKSNTKAHASASTSSSFLKSFDIFGEQVNFTWNGEDSFKTKVSFLVSLIAYTFISLVIFNYAYLYIACTEPNVYFHSDLIVTDNNSPMNLTDTIYPSLLFYLYDPNDKSSRFVVDNESIICNFQFSAYKQNDSIMTGGTNIEKVNITNVCDTVDKIPDVMKNFYQPYKNEFLCMEADQVVYGETNFCTNCQYYYIKMYEKTAAERAKCKRNIEANNIILYIINNNANVNITRFDDPWGHELYTSSLWINTDINKLIYFNYGNKIVSDTARNFGQISSTKEYSKIFVEKVIMENKNRDSTSINYKAGIYSEPLLELYLMPSIHHAIMDRSYPTFLDTASDIGGIIELITLPLAIFYSLYVSKQIRNDLVHRGVMITGKYNINEKRADILNEVQPSNYYKKFNHSEMIVGRKGSVKRHCCQKYFCCFKKNEFLGASEKELQLINRKMKEEDEKNLSRAFDSLQDRQLDIKHYLNMCQEFEIIKRILLKERHIVLAPLITIEAEKRANQLKDLNEESEKENVKIILSKEFNPKVNGIIEQNNLYNKVSCDKPINVNKIEKIPVTCCKKHLVDANFYEAIGNAFLKKTDVKNKSDSEKEKLNKMDNLVYFLRGCNSKQESSLSESKIDNFNEKKSLQSSENCNQINTDIENQLSSLTEIVNNLKSELTGERAMRQLLENRFNDLEKNVLNNNLSENNKQEITKTQIITTKQITESSKEPQWDFDQVDEGDTNKYKEKMLSSKNNNTQGDKTNDTKLKSKLPYDFKAKPSNKDSTDNTKNDSSNTKKTNQLEQDIMDFKLQSHEFTQRLENLEGLKANNTRYSHIIDPKNNEYNSSIYKQMERSDFPESEDFTNVISNSIDQLINKPIDSKNPIEERLDAMYIEYLPKGFIQYNLNTTEIDSIPKNLKKVEITEADEYELPK